MKPTIEMADTLASLKALALSHPTVSITLRDESTGEVEFQSFVSQSIEEAYGHLFQGDDQTLVSFKRQQNTWRVKGFFGTNGYVLGFSTSFGQKFMQNISKSYNDEKICESSFS